MRLKLIAIYLTTLFLFSFGGYWLWEKRNLEEKLNWNEHQIKSQAQQIQNNLDQDFSRLEAFLIKQIQESQKTPLFPFESVQVYQKDLQNWKKVRSYSLTELDLPTILLPKNLPSRHFYLSNDVKNPSEINYFYMTSDKELIAFRLMNDPLSQLLDSNKGSHSQFRIVNDDRVVMGHPTSEYRGQKLDQNDDLFKLQSDQKVLAKQAFVNGDNYFVFAEKIKRSNLQLESFSSVQPILNARVKARWQWIFLILGLGFIGLSLILIFISDESAKPQNKAETLIEPETNQLTTFVHRSEPSSIQVDQRLKQFSEHLEKPLMNILSQTHCLDWQEPGANKESAEKIQKESEKIYSLLEAIKDEPSKDFDAFQKVKPSQLVDRLLTKFADSFLHKRIHIEREYHYLDTVWLKPRQFNQALEKIVQNSIEALENKLDKKMKFSIQKMGQEIQIIIEDNGQGIAENHTSHVFDPLFTTKSQQDHPGLGLTQARKWIQEQNGKIQIQSQSNKYTQVMIQIPLFEPLQESDFNLFDERSFKETLDILEPEMTPPEIQAPSNEILKKTSPVAKQGLDFFPVKIRKPQLSSNDKREDSV